MIQTCSFNARYSSCEQLIRKPFGLHPPMLRVNSNQTYRKFMVSAVPLAVTPILLMACTASVAFGPPPSSRKGSTKLLLSVCQ